MTFVRYSDRKFFYQGSDKITFIFKLFSSRTILIYKTMSCQVRDKEENKVGCNEYFTTLNKHKQSYQCND